MANELQGSAEERLASGANVYEPEGADPPDDYDAGSPVDEATSPPVRGTSVADQQRADWARAPRITQ